MHLGARLGAPICGPVPQLDAADPSEHVVGLVADQSAARALRRLDDDADGDTATDDGPQRFG